MRVGAGCMFTIFFRNIKKTGTRTCTLEDLHVYKLNIKQQQFQIRETTIDRARLKIKFLPTGFLTDI